MTNSLKIFALFILFSLHLNLSKAQTLGLNFLFNPGLRISTELMPMVKKDSNELKINRLNLGLILPFGGKAKLSLKELSAGYKQSFFSMNMGVRNVSSHELKSSQSQIANFNISLTHLNLRVGKGTLFYTFNLGVLNELQNNSKMNLFGMAAMAYVQVKGLRKQNIYGAALTYSFGKFLPVPIFGFNRKISEKMDLQVLLPVSIELTHRINGKMSLSFANSMNIFRTFMSQSVPYNSDFNLQYFQLQSLLSFEAFITKKTSFILQPGIAYMRQATTYEMQKSLKSNNLSPTFLFNAQIRVNLGKTLVNSQGILSN